MLTKSHPQPLSQKKQKRESLGMLAKILDMLTHILDFELPIVIGLSHYQELIRKYRTVKFGK